MSISLGDTDTTGQPTPQDDLATEGEVEAQSNEESDSDPRADVADTETQTGIKQVMYSGGAYGGDTLFDDVAWTAGIKRIHLTGDSDVVASKSLRQRGVKAVQVPKDKLAQAREQIKKLIGRTLQDNFIGNLHARNYYQVKDADAVYAVAPMRRDSKGVLGGTDTAVQVGLALGKEVYVWDTTTLQWHSWDGSKFVASGLPPLRAKFAGVGTRDVEAYTTKDKATGQWVTNPKYLGDSVRTAAQEAVTSLLKQKVEASNEDTITESETLTTASQDENTDTVDMNVPPQAETPVEGQTGASETKEIIPRNTGSDNVIPHSSVISL